MNWKVPAFILCKEKRGYSVWSIGLSGSRQECYGQFSSKQSALKLLRQLRKAADEKESAS